MLSFAYFGLLINGAILYILALKVKGSQSLFESKEHQNAKQRLVESYLKISGVWLELCTCLQQVN